MIYIIWEFQIDSSQRTTFEQAYGSQGAWAKLFQQSEAYYGTTLLRDSNNPDRYLTIDCWNTFTAFNNFQDQYANTYQKLDKICETMTLSEKRIGVFENI